MKITTLFCCSLALCAVVGSRSSGQTFPYLEGFDSDDAGWVTGDRMAVTYVATGGSDGGGYISDDFAFAEAGSFGAVLFRANTADPDFQGDWVDAGVDEVTFSVRHDAPIPLAFSARFASPFNFPGSSAVSFAPVAPNAFTELSFEISPTSPQFVTFEGADFETVFSNIGNLQVTADLPPGFVTITQALIDSGDAPVGAAIGDVFATANDLPVGTPLFNNSLPITFDLDAYSITAVPEPGAALLALAGWIVAASARRSRD